MNLPKYDYFIDPGYASFTFQSVGPNGIIKKVVNYRPIPGFIFLERQVINLGFGDWNIDLQKVDDSIISDNNDRNKILATVASTILEFTDKHGKLPIFAKGSSPARTRLYQMGINANLPEIERQFFVLGLTKEKWQKFVPGINFDAFLVVRK